MYSLKAILDKEPAAIAGAVQVILPVLVLLGVVSLDDKAMAGIVLVISTVLALFVRGASTSKAAPVLAAGTEVKVAGSQDSVIVAPSPPGPVGIEGG
jgi:BRCT domain type II-containing protein